MIFSESDNTLDLLTAVNELREQRDHARRIVCKLSADLSSEMGAEPMSPRGYARQLGWEYLYSDEAVKK